MERRGEERKKHATSLQQAKDGNGASSDWVECLRTQTRNSNLKSESTPNTNLGENEFKV